MKKFLKIFSVLFLLLILLFGLAVLFLKSIFTEEKIRKVAQEIVTKTIPEGQLQLGELRTNLGWNFEIKIEDLTLSNRGDLSRENSLIFIKNLSFTLPIYSVFNKTPEINLRVSHVEFRSFETLSKDSNKKEAKMTAPAVENTKASENKTFIEKYGDTLLKNSALNFSSEDFTFFRVYLNRQSKEVKCQKINLRFESIGHPLFLNLNCAGDTGETEPGLKGIIALRGEINTQELIEKKNLKFSGSFILENPHWPPIGTIPTIRGKVEGLNINDEGVSVPFKVSVDKWGSGSLILTNKSGETILDSVDWNFNFDALNFLLNKMPFSREGQFGFKGKLSFLKKGFYPEIDLETKKLVLTLKETKIPVSISGKIKGKNFNMHTLLRVFKGSAASNVSGTVNWENLSIPFGPMKIESLISSMEFNISKKKENNQSKEKDKDEPFEYPIPDFPLKVKMKIEKVRLEKIEINGISNFSSDKKKNLKLDMILTFNEAPAHIDAALLNSKKNAFLDFKLRGFDLSLLENLIPEKLGLFKGSADINFNGTFPFPKINVEDFSFKVNFKAIDGEYNNPYLGKNWEDFIKENPGLEKYISKNAQPYVDFEKIILNGDIHKGKIEIDKFLFQAPNDKLLIHAKGNIGLDESKKSLVYMNMKDKMGITLSSVKNLFGMETLYFKLVGMGLKLKPDLTYTSSKIIENTATDLPKNLWKPIDTILINPFRGSKKDTEEKKPK